MSGNSSGDKGLCFCLCFGSSGIQHMVFKSKPVQLHCRFHTFHLHLNWCLLISFLLLHRLYKERLSQVDIKLQEVMAGCAPEYLEPLANLQENMQIRTKVAGEITLPSLTFLCQGFCLWTLKDMFKLCLYSPTIDLLSAFAAGIYRELCLESVKNKYECEIQAACQHWEVRVTHGLRAMVFSLMQ